ncbi:hypothetical protein BJ742DRAFT_864892 [Cladochytrium replicatum]|nr:hypothetical protein BJ742DRAFT_864892 [Cladochytrium replicatum]
MSAQQKRKLKSQPTKGHRLKPIEPTTVKDPGDEAPANAFDRMIPLAHLPKTTKVLAADAAAFPSAPNLAQPSSAPTQISLSSRESNRTASPVHVPSLDSKVPEFRAFHKNIPHPAMTLNLMADESDRQVFSEFDRLCNEVLAVMGEFEASLEEMTIWKDGFLKTSVPSSVKLQLALLFSRLFRSKSDLHEPLFELLKRVRMYSRPWTDKCAALIELEKDYKRQTHVLDVAIRKLEQLHFQVLRMKGDRRLYFWERLTKRMMEYQYNAATKAVDPGPTRPDTSAQDEPSSEENTVPGTVRPQTSFAFGFQSIDEALRRPWTDKNKGDAIGYISEGQPTWNRKRRLRTLARRFRQIARYHFPQLKNILTRAHAHPYPHQPRILYPSMFNGTFQLCTRRIPSQRKEWSCIDLASLFPNHSVGGYDTASLSRSGFFSSSSSMRDYTFEEFEEGWDEWEEGGKVEGEAKRQAHMVRSNSFDALWSLGDARQLKRLNANMLQDGDQMVINGEQLEDAMFGNLEEVFDGDEDGWEDEESDISDAGSSVDDVPYFNHDDEDIRAAVESQMFMLRQNQENGIIDGGLEIDPMGKDSFTMKDVVELTLLHAQQMQLLGHEYEKREQELLDRMQQMEADHASQIQDWKIKHQSATERIQMLAQEYKLQKEEAIQMAAIASAASAAAVRAEMAAEEAGRMDNVEEEGGDVVIRSRYAGYGRRRRRKTGWKDRRAMQGRRPPAHLHKKALPKVKTPVFRGVQFSMNFMDRMRWATEQHLKHHAQLKHDVMRQEIAANEKRLKHAKLLRPESSTLLNETRRLPATFMPHPGQVPLPRYEAWIERDGFKGSPWGGKFHRNAPMNRNDRTQKVNILNLFDVAMAMRQHTLKLYGQEERI